MNDWYLNMCLRIIQENQDDIALRFIQLVEI